MAKSKTKRRGRPQGMTMGKANITIFDQPYPKDKQAEGLAISIAVATGKCNDCEFLKQCENDRAFQFPPQAWCQQQKQRILKEWG